MKFRFGKWEGRELSDPEVPAAYIRSLLANRVEFEAELARRKQAAEDDTGLIKQIISRGFASLYKDARSGPGTDEERGAQMVLVEGAVAALNIMLSRYGEDYGPPSTVKRRRQNYARQLLDDKFIDDEDRAWAMAELEDEEDE